MQRKTKYMTLTLENIQTFVESTDASGKRTIRQLWRFLTDGYGAAVDDDLEERLAKACTIEKKEELQGIGTWNAPMMHYTYRTPDGKTRHIYEIVSTAIDSWQTEWICSGEPMGNSAAADLILQARQMELDEIHRKIRNQGGQQ